MMSGEHPRRARTAALRSAGRLFCAVALLTVVLSGVAVAAAASAPTLYETQLIAVDLGADWMKTAAFRLATNTDGDGVSSGGATASIVLNDQANRKSPPCIAFRYFRNPHYDPENQTSTEPRYVLERAFAEQARALASRFPTQVVCSPTLLLGHATRAAATEAAARAGQPAEVFTSLTRDPSDLDSTFLVDVVPSSEADRDALAAFLPYTVSAKAEADAVAANADNGVVYSAEELTAMLLGHAKRAAEKADREDNRVDEATARRVARRAGVKRGKKGLVAMAAHNVVRFAAVTVPSFASLAERQAVVDAGAAAGLRVVRLVHSTTAAATQLAYLKTQLLFPPVTASASASAPSRYVMVYDMGSRQTEAAVFEFQSAHATRALASYKTHSRVEGSIILRAMATNRTLGGKAFDECIASYWDRTYLNGAVLGSILPPDASLHDKREAAKRRFSLLRAANVAREMLSANREAPVTVDGVLVPGSEHTFTTKLTRSSFEQICAPLFEEAVRVRNSALAATTTTVNGAPLTVAQLTRLEVFGGATRMPKLLEALSVGYGSGMVDRTLNGDEAAVMGATYLAAVTARFSLQRFRVREWLTNDIAFAVSPALRHSPPENADVAEETESLVVEDNGSVVPELLFSAKVTEVPAIRSVRLRNRSSDFIFSFYSPPAVAAAVVAKGLPQCPGCFVQHYRVDHFDAAHAAVAAATSKPDIRIGKTEQTETTLAVVSSETVVEAGVSESGLPLIHKAYLRVTYNKTVVVRPVSTTTTTTAAPGDGEETSRKGDSGDTAEGIETDSLQADTMNSSLNDEEAEVETEEAAEEARAETVVADSAVEGQTTTSVIVRVYVLQVHLVEGGESRGVGGSAPPPSDSPLSTAVSPLPRGVNLRRGELQHSRLVVRDLQVVDDARFQRSSLRNDIEGLVVAIKSTDAWDSETVQGDMDAVFRAAAAAEEAELQRVAVPPASSKDTAEKTAEDPTITTATPTEPAEPATEGGNDKPWREYVQDISEWLEDYGEDAKADVLEAKKAQLQAVKQWLQSVAG